MLTQTKIHRNFGEISISIESPKTADKVTLTRKSLFICSFECCVRTRWCRGQWRMPKPLKKPLVKHNCICDHTCWAVECWMVSVWRSLNLPRRLHFPVHTNLQMTMIDRRQTRLTFYSCPHLDETSFSPCHSRNRPRNRTPMIPSPGLGHLPRLPLRQESKKIFFKKMLRHSAVSLKVTLLFFVGRPFQRASPLAPRCHCGMTKIPNPDRLRKLIFWVANLASVRQRYSEKIKTAKAF